jgi:hypothetical protein
VRLSTIQRHVHKHRSRYGRTQTQIGLPQENVCDSRGAPLLHQRPLISICLSHLEQQKYQCDNNGDAADETANRGKV